MTLIEILASILISLGVLLALVAAIGMARFEDVLSRMHASSKPQTLGLILVLAGAALAAGSWSIAGVLLLVLFAQMLTVPVASAMVGRAAFRRGFVRGSSYAIDELSPRLADPEDVDDDEDGFVDEFEGDEDGTMAIQAAERFPENVVPPEDHTAALDLSNWGEEESEDEDDTSDLDIDLADETEIEAGQIAERDRRAREERAARTARENHRPRTH